jgi:hypothetical protein
MRRWYTPICAVTIASLFAACGEGGTAPTRESSPQDEQTASGRHAAPLSARESALGLTRRLPRAYRQVCERQASDAPVGARTCPPLIPAGALKVGYRGRSLGRDSSGGGFSADFASRSLGQFYGKRIETNGGHWRYDVVWTPRVRRLVVGMGIRRRPTNAPGSSSCRQTRVAAQRMLACRVVAYDRGGGVNGGHVAFVWEHARVTFVISVHGYANAPRARAMMAAVVAATGN